MSEGRPGIRPLQSREVSGSRPKFKTARKCEGLIRRKHFESGREAYLDRFAQFSVVAAREAMRDSGLELTPRLRENGAVFAAQPWEGSRHRNGIRGPLRFRSRPRSSADDSQNHGERRSQPNFDGLGTYGTDVHGFDCVFFGQSCNRPGVSAWCVTVRSEMAVTGGSEAPFMIGLLKAWEAMRVISLRHLPAVQQGSQRHDPGRRWRDDDPRASRSRQGARRENLLRNLRLWG